MSDRSLTEFASDDAAADDPSPPDPTYRWTPDGRKCGSCGNTVTVLWAGDFGLICATCKEW